MTTSISWLYRVIETDTDPLRNPPRPRPDHSAEGATSVSSPRNIDIRPLTIWPCWVG
jgi:hypothetical protein